MLSYPCSEHASLAAALTGERAWGLRMLRAATRRSSEESSNAAPDTRGSIPGACKPCPFSLSSLLEEVKAGRSGPVEPRCLGLVIFCVHVSLWQS